MKRLLLAVTAGVLVLTASGASAAGSGKRLTVKAVAAQREHAARREARRLLSEFVPPAGARRTRKPPRQGGWGSSPGAKFVDAHHFWTVPKPLKAVASSIESAEVRGVRATLRQNGPHYLSWDFSWPRTGVSRRLLTVVAVPHRTGTDLRVDAKVVWIYPRSPREKVPAGVREITLDAPKMHLTVTAPAKVQRIIRWFDALPISPPGVSALCGIAPANYTIALSFRSARHRALASAQLPPLPASICNGIGFTIGGHPQAPLVDNFYSHAPLRHSFVARLQRLLGVRLLTHS
jgi:hypothetical protein